MQIIIVLNLCLSLLILFYRCFGIVEITIDKSNCLANDGFWFEKFSTNFFKTSIVFLKRLEGA